MNHSFVPSQLDKEKCGICKYNFLQHSAMAECQACKNIGMVNPVKTILMCQACEEREIALTLEMTKPENVAARVSAVQNAFTVGNGNGNDSNKMRAISMEASRIMHNEISVRDDIYNAKTQSIHALEQELIANPEVNNAYFVLAETLMGSLKTFQDVIFDANAAIVKAGNEQRATIVYINQLANKLRVEEREKLKIADINYKPLPPKLSKVGRPSKSTSSVEKSTKSSGKKYKLKTSELHMLMKQTELPGHIIAQLSIRGMSIEDIIKWAITNKAKMATPAPIVNKPVVEDEVVDMDELEGN